MINVITAGIQRALAYLIFPTVSFIDLLEILILAFLIYKLLVWIKDSHAWTLLKGIITIGICVALVYILKMNTLIYITSRFINVAIICAAVVFQPELRKVLESLGERDLISSLLPLENMGSTEQTLFSDHTVNELVRSCMEMSRSKTGALIVIRRKENLTEYERTGIRIDALVSSQLLINIFEHNTPLHDGAVIIDGDRVTAATCYLPLSDNMALSKDLGTRHRAGVGISEATDSFTIIVSEETGGISVAYRGKLTRDITSEYLRERLKGMQDRTVIQRKFKLRKGRANNE